VAYLLTHFWPGGTEEQYRATLDAVHPPGGLPDGQRYHAAGPTEGGLLIAVVWDSKEQSDRFVSETLMAAMPVEGGLTGSPEARGAEVVNLVTA
jgi:selenophosphate synthase